METTRSRPICYHEIWGVPNERKESEVKIAFVSSEIAPFASTGGLGEVSGSLTRALVKQGATVVRIMPMYRQVLEGNWSVRDTGRRLRIPVGYRVHTAEIWTDDQPECPTVFIRRDEYFDRRELYALPEREYSDNLERFIFFQKTVVAWLDETGWGADVVHGNDWTSGLLPFYLRYGITGSGRTGSEAMVFTVHNLAYQGIYPGADFPLTNLPFDCFSIDGLEFYGNINCLKGGLTQSHMVTTVSPTYAQEVRTPEFGCGLDGVLRTLGDRFVGILNGLDEERWNPAQDRFLVNTYDARDISGKRACKHDLLRRTGLGGRPERALAGIISRMVDEKGFDLLAEAMPRLVEMPLDVVILGKGTEKYHRLASEWMQRWPGRVWARIGYDEPLAHQIQAGADIFLMPSRIEPCGISQMCAIRYGTLPIVHATGGLKDTVKNLSDDGRSGNGIAFGDFTVDAFLAAIQRALTLYGTDVWAEIVHRLLQEKNDWERPAREYLEVYGRALSLRK